MTENIQKTDKTGQNNDQSLFEDLERRYGFAMAQEIIDQLKKAENLKKSVSAPVDYMVVKALSEAAEIYRQDAKVALKLIKTCRRNKTAPSKNIVEFDDAFLQREFDRSFAFYLRFHRGYHVFYRQAMEAYSSELKEKINANTDRIEQLKGLLEDKEEVPVLLQPSMAKHYREEVKKLIASLTLPENRQEAAEMLRGLVEKVAIIPKGEGQGVDIDLHGNLAGILTIAAKNKTKSEKIELIQQVESVTEGCDRLTSDMQKVMVAGARFELTTFRL